MFTFEIGINGDPSVEKMPDRNNSKRHKTTPGQKNENKKALRLSFGRHELSPNEESPNQKSPAVRKY